MDIINAQDVVKEAMSQMSGVVWTLSDGSTPTTPELAALDSYNIVDVGKSLDLAADPTISRDSFFKRLISVISDIRTMAKAYIGDMSGFMVKDYEWGGFTERIYPGLADIIDDPMWNLQANFQNNKRDYSSEELSFYPLPVSAQIYTEAKPILIPISKPAEQLKEAFTSWGAMQEFITSIAIMVDNTMQLGLQAMRHNLAQCAIAISMSTLTNPDGTTRPPTAINLAQRYYDLTGQTVTAADWRNDPAFIAFCMETIAETRDNISTYNTAFNDGTWACYTDSSDSRLILLNQFEKACRFRVKANTYNKDDLAIGDYDRTTMWQAFAATGQEHFAFSTASSVMISADASNKLGIGTSAFTGENVIGLLYDYRGLGICPYKRKVTGKFVAVADFYNEFSHILVNMLLDRKFPLIAFYIGTVTP